MGFKNGVFSSPIINNTFFKFIFELAWLNFVYMLLIYFLRVSFLCWLCSLFYEFKKWLFFLLYNKFHRLSCDDNEFLKLHKFLFILFRYFEGLLHANNSYEKSLKAAIGGNILQTADRINLGCHWDGGKGRLHFPHRWEVRTAWRT
jgi:hypothetical protein